MRVCIAFAVGLCACAERGNDDTRKTILEVPVTPNRDLDLLFMVDDSPGTALIQLNLANSFPSLINVLDTLPGGLPDLHVGVITSDMGTKTSSSPTPAPPIGQVGIGGCADTGRGGALRVTGAPVTGSFVSDIRQMDGSRQRNYTGALADVFSQMARVGSGGCGFEQPLAAVRAALDNHPSNAGFLRREAVLGIVFLVDEDDCTVTDPKLFDPNATELGALQSFRCTQFGVTCSTGGATPDAMSQLGTKNGCGPNATAGILDDVTPFRDFLVGLKDDPSKVVVTGIAGTPEPFVVESRAPPGGGTIPALTHSCSWIDSQGFTNVADPAVRLAAFLDLFPGRSTFSTVCQPDLFGALDQIGQLLGAAAGSPCVPIALPTGADCVVEDVLGATVTPIAPCGAAPCWRLEVDAATCVFSEHQKLVIDRVVPPDPATVTRLRCKL